MKAIVTGSGGLVGSEAVSVLCEHGWDVVGLDNDSRQTFLGARASTRRVFERLDQSLQQYRHLEIDVRDREAVRLLFQNERPDLVIHAAGQPSHDRAAKIPYDDFDVNAVGTLNLLVAARDFAPSAPFCFTSSNKVYGDRPNRLELVEQDRRFDYASGGGIDETMPIDQCLHSLFGASKVAADVVCQEFGRYFDMPVGIFRLGCLTGPRHAAVPLHGFLAYIVGTAVSGGRYKILGYKGKQVRDQLHCRDLVGLFLEFFENPRPGDVYNVGGGRANSISILETVDVLAELGYPLDYDYQDTPRMGDHICYISDLSKAFSHYPGWKIQIDVPTMIRELVQSRNGDLFGTSPS